MPPDPPDLLARHDELRGLLADCVAENDALLAENERLEVKYQAVTTEIDRLTTQVALLVAERDEARRQADAALAGWARLVNDLGKK